MVITKCHSEKVTTAITKLKYITKNQGREKKTTILNNNQKIKRTLCKLGDNFHPLLRG